MRPDQVPFVFRLAGNGRPVMPMVPVVLTVFSAWLAWLEPMAGGLCLCVPAGRSDGMGIFDAFWKGEDSVATLTAAEAAEFARLDQAVGMAVKAARVVEAGAAALATIKSRQLYRDSATSWDAYCESHGISVRRADQIIAAFKVREMISSEGRTAVLGLAERAIRPLVSLSASDANEVIAEASAVAGGITPKSIRQAAARRKQKTATKLPRPIRHKVPGWVIVATPNRAAAATGFDVAAALEAAAAAERRKMAG